MITMHPIVVSSMHPIVVSSMHPIVVSSMHPIVRAIHASYISIRDLYKQYAFLACGRKVWRFLNELIRGFVGRHCATL